jgi:Predicted metal-dependent protease of the PAD1/JAB1 superfamily
MREKIFVPRQCLLTMVLAAQEIFPKECFGFVLGRGNEVTRIYTLQSVVNRRSSVVFDKEDLLVFKSAVEQTLRDEKVIGTFHSHPGTDTTLAPSEADKVNLAIVPYLFIVWMPKCTSKVRAYKSGRWGLRQSIFAQVGAWLFKGRRLVRVQIVETEG